MLTLNAPLTAGMFTGVVMCLTAPNWLFSWMGMELNFLCFTMLVMTSSTRTRCAQGGTTYFLAQTAGSAFFLFGIGLSYSNYLSFSPMFILFGLTTKLGMMPFYHWFPSAANDISWVAVGLLLTLQKAAPLALLVAMIYPPYIASLHFLVGVNAAVGAWVGLNQSRIKVILAFSSIAHLSWMVAVGTVSFLFSAVYYFIYSASVLPLVGLLSMLGVDSLKTAHLVSRSSPAALFLFTMFLLNLSGMPPFVGFFAKAVALKALLLCGHSVLALVLILSSAMTMGFYLTIAFVALLASTHGPRSSRRPQSVMLWVLALSFALGGLPLAFLFL